jgi:hypothetical protein
MKYVTKYNKTHYVYKYIRRDLYEAFIKWCGEDSINLCLEKALKVLAADVAPVANTAPNVQTNTVQSKTVVKCFSRAKMRYPVESYVTLFKSKGILVDWWEEGEDRVCFELESEKE